MYNFNTKHQDLYPCGQVAPMGYFLTLGSLGMFDEGMGYGYYATFVGNECFVDTNIKIMPKDAREDKIDKTQRFVVWIMNPEYYEN